MMKKEESYLPPSFSIVADNIPEAHYELVKQVFEHGMSIRTQYDRKDSRGEFIDPPSKDASMLVEIRNPFNQPRYPIISCCERGAYIAEILGVKDHLVIPYKQLKEQLSSGKGLTSTEWPYTYHQRLFEFPLANGKALNQMENLLDRLVSSPETRRAVATTRVPEIDIFLKDDQPCLGEVQLRCTEHRGEIYLNMCTRWRSRDSFKAWHDNVIGLTFMQQVLAKRMSEKIGKEVLVGNYRDFSDSLHIYGQDMISGGSAGMTAEQYLALGKENVLKRAMTSDFAKEAEIIPQLEDLLAPAKIEEWKFGEKQLNIIKDLIEGLNSGRYVA